ncbi:MAG: PD-(D/E)XK nuclease family protein [Muribaculaceae bacterium]|nr:PD-(D/E)XK nuclease family protein [Muribaculaceae bacterium]
MNPTTTHRPFLQQIAQHYADSGDLCDHCFVFPTRRACTFFKTYLKHSQQPKVATVSDFLIDQITHLKPAGSVEALFILYRCYVELTSGDGDEFDRFVHWGNVVLSDFNDVDMALVAPKDIFSNIKSWREISTDHLSDEVKEKIKAFFNVDFNNKNKEDSSFWEHLKPADEQSINGNEVMQRHAALWQILAPLYDSFTERLARQGKAYPGMVYRKAVDRIGEMGPDDFPSRHYVFAGFNMLSRSEHKIFSLMQNKGIASFFWDDASPALAIDENIGAKWIKQLVRDFPSPPSFTLDPIKDYPEVHVLGVPSNVGQAKCAFDIINELIDSKDIASNEEGEATDAINTAIVLPDEGLVAPLLGSVSPRVKRLNITMGYPMRGSDIVSLMRVVARTHRHARARVAPDGTKQWVFFRDDVRDVLSHPIIKAYYGREALRLEDALNASNAFSVDENIFAYSQLKSLFTTLRQSDSVDAAIDYLKSQMAFVDQLLTAMLSLPPREGEDKPSLSVQAAFLTHYRHVVEQIAQSFKEYGLNVTEDTFFYLIDRLVSGITLPFEGDPLQGLQVMGLLETRCLDFENMIVLSVNERTLPRRFRPKSMVSEFNRILYGMATIEHQDANWAYYFYHLLARANKVYLLYDARNDTLSGGEPSRYVAQLEKVHKVPLHKTIFNTELPAIKKLEIAVPKNDRIMARLRHFLADEKETPRNLSASALNDYVTCPLKFYLKRIEGLSDENEKGDFMDSTTFGSIVHNTLQQLYYPDVNGERREGKYNVNAEDIRRFKPEELRPTVMRNICKEYLSRDDDGTPLKGEAAIVMETIVLYVEKVLNYDLATLGDAPGAFFEVWECERERKTPLTLGSHTINFKFYADRIDRINGEGPLRLIDYKTGNDVTTFKKMDDLFVEKSGTKRRKAILQLLLYANAYVKVNEDGYDDAIMPMIYSLRKMGETGVLIGRTQLDDYRDINTEFLTAMGKTIDDLFNPKVPFTQLMVKDVDRSPCSYCHFAAICHR